MYVCLCNCVTDRQLVEAAAEFGDQSGVNSAVIATQVADRLGAGLGCGSCREFALDLVEQAATRQMSVILSDHAPASTAFDTSLSESCRLPVNPTIVRNDGARAP